MTSLSPSTPPTAPSVIGEAPCSDGACTGFATATPRRGWVCHYGRTVITFLSFIGILDLKYMYVRCPLFVFYIEPLLKYTMETTVVRYSQIAAVRIRRYTYSTYSSKSDSYQRLKGVRNTPDSKISTYQHLMRYHVP